MQKDEEEIPVKTWKYLGYIKISVKYNPKIQKIMQKGDGEIMEEFCGDLESTSNASRYSQSILVFPNS